MPAECAGCGEPLGSPWGQCNLTPAISYHRECCPGCAEEPRRTVIEFEHGTINGYANYGCRCAPCREVENAWRRSYARRRPERRNLRRGVRT